MVKDQGNIELRYLELKAAYKRSENEKIELGEKFKDLKKDLLTLQQIVPDYEKAKEEASKLQKALDNKKSCTQQEQLAKEELKIAKEHNKVLKEQIVNCKLLQKQQIEKYETLQKSSKVIQQQNDEMITEVRKLKEENKQLINHQVALRSTNAELKEKVESAVVLVSDNEMEKKMNQQLREKSKEISSLKENCKEYEEKLQSLVTELMSKERVQLHLVENLDTLKFVNKQLELKLDEFTNSENGQFDEEIRFSCKKEKTNNYTEKQIKNLGKAIGEPTKETTIEHNDKTIHCTEKIENENKEDGVQEDSMIVVDEWPGDQTESMHETHEDDSLIQPSPKKLKMCRYFIKGKCKKGDECTYSHCKQNEKQCQYFQEGSCRFGKDCWFVHGEEECSYSREEKPIKKPVRCKNFEDGSCEFGDQCRFSHDIKTLQDNTPICWHQENCRYGAKCKFKHTRNKDSQRSKAKENDFHEIKNTNGSKNKQSPDMKEIARMVWALKDLVDLKM